jgi:hypothetical protein
MNIRTRVNDASVTGADVGGNAPRHSPAAEGATVNTEQVAGLGDGINVIQNNIRLSHISFYFIGFWLLRWSHLRH